MTAKAARKNKTGRNLSPPTISPDLAWYQDASDRRKRNAHIKLIVRSDEEIEQRLRIDDRFMREILDHGKVMYEATDR
ncbi:MAG: hypothetical protein ACREA2_02265 [Blastocatellia bacterium]